MNLFHRRTTPAFDWDDLPPAPVQIDWSKAEDDAFWDALDNPKGRRWDAGFPKHQRAIKATVRASLFAITVIPVLIVISTVAANAQEPIQHATGTRETPIVRALTHLACQEDEVIAGVGDYKGPAKGWDGYVCVAADDLAITPARATQRPLPDTDTEDVSN